MDWNLQTRLTRKEKPMIRKVAGNWVAFVRIGTTDQWAATLARKYCTRINKA